MMTEEEKANSVRQAYWTVNVVSEFLKDVADSAEACQDKRPAWVIMREVSEQVEEMFGFAIKKFMST